MEISTNEKNEHKFVCIKCNFKCSYNSDYKRHILTARHKTDMIEPKRKSTKTTLQYTCDCGKSYKNNSGLWKHRQKCNILKEETIIDQTIQPNNLIADNSIVNNLMKQNEILQEFIIEHKKEKEEHKRRDEEHKKQIEEQQRQHKEEIKKLSSQISNISTVTNNKTTNNNNKFNLNFFLNTQCKDAMSIQSFMENLKLGCKELEHMGDVGYLNGMIDIFNSTIGNMDVYKRPLHCTDLKREVLYFKQGNDWERDSEDKKHLKKLIKNVESKNYDNLQEWQKDHPGSLQCDSRDSEHYMKIATEALGGADSNKDSIYLTKIMKHIVREVHVKN
uniref:C2H2-type domain-containing protein n=1 Tax=viral metagenome TaxID=1070528 RepID=A0A6C0C156_9ZZZZ